MFTGIVSHLGEIHDINRLEDWQLAIKVNKSAVSSNNFNDVIIGASVACSGICLTVKKKCEDFLYFDVSDETASKTNFLNWKIGNIINLEKSLRVGDEIGGHFVYGHVDTTARVKNIEKISGSYKVVFLINTDFIKYFAQKGSVTIDGVSLTVNEVTSETFSVNIVPFTWDNTSFSNYMVNTVVNIEIDILARYLERINISK